MDAAHFVFSPFLGILWCFERLFVKAPSGRQRLNVLAALNAITHELVSVTNQSYINAQSVCDLLSQLALKHLHMPVTVVLDNARYQRCKLVQELAKQLGIELLFLPPYSPNLNLIERFGSSLRSTVCTRATIPTVLPFQQAILGFIATSPSRYKTKLENLLTLKFQTFQDVPTVPEPQPLTLPLTARQRCGKTLPVAA